MEHFNSADAAVEMNRAAALEEGNKRLLATNAALRVRVSELAHQVGNLEKENAEMKKCSAPVKVETKTLRDEFALEGIRILKGMAAPGIMVCAYRFADDMLAARAITSPVPSQ